MELDKFIHYIFYERDNNPEKTWGHIWGWTMPHAYVAWNFNYKNIEEYKNIFSRNLKNNSLYDIVINWYKGKFQRNYLKKYIGIFKNNYLFFFLFALSDDKISKYNYYFRFSEKTDKIGEKYLLNSVKLNPNFLLSNIALASYYHHHQKLEISYLFYKKALNLDKNNPWIKARYGLLLASLGKVKKYNELMIEISRMIPEEPWVWEWLADSYNKLSLYEKALKSIEKYEILTLGKHRTFEPFLRKAQAYFGLGKYSLAKKELEKKDIYYFGKGYYYLYEDLSKKIKFNTNT